ncbi:hypothetical protein EV359DRAFT_68191 [Lentinula novae-zelandiae]|nr:hypothetical protein EV359DRAFT_68191 [Lentinula novae-zelandiae]
MVTVALEKHEKQLAERASRSREKQIAPNVEDYPTFETEQDHSQTVEGRGKQISYKLSLCLNLSMMYTGSDSELAKRHHSEEVVECISKVRVVSSSASSPLIRQQQARINELEQEVQALNEEVSGLTYCEDESLERAKIEVAQLYKKSLNFQAEIFRLKAQNNALNERLSFIQPSIPAGHLEYLHIATQTSPPQHTNITLNIASETHNLSPIAGAFDEEKDIHEEEPLLEINSQSSITLVDLVQYPLDAASNQQASLWFPDAFAYVNVDLGAEYQSLVSTWIDLERTIQWRTNAKVRLPTVNRLSLLAEWVDKKRYKCKANKLNIKDCGIEFAENVKTWWTSFQPAWRQGLTEERSSLLHIGSDEWKSIDKFGLNVEDNTQGKGDWLKIVRDVCHVMKALVEHCRDTGSN